MSWANMIKVQGEQGKSGMKAGGSLRQVRLVRRGFQISQHS